MTSPPGVATGATVERGVAWLLACFLAVFMSGTGSALAFDFTSRAVIQTGDTVDRFGQIGTRIVGAVGIDDRGRVLITAVLNSGRQGLYWLDSDRIEAVWESDTEELDTLGSLTIGGDGRILTTRGDAAYEITPAGDQRLLVRAGDRIDTGEVVCWIGGLSLNRAGHIAFPSRVAADLSGCGLSQSGGVFVLRDGVIRRVFDSASRGGLDPLLVGIASDGAVALNFRDYVVLVAGDGTEMEIGAAGTGGFDSAVGLAIAPGGDVLFVGFSDGNADIYRVRVDGPIEPVLRRGDVLEGGAVVRDFLVSGALAANGAAAVMAYWSTTDPGGLLSSTLGTVVRLADGTMRIVGADQSLRGINAAGDIAVIHGSVNRWRAGRLEPLITSRDRAPDGSVFAIGGLTDVSCMSDDGRVAAVAFSTDGDAGLICADAGSPQTIARRGDPSPDGGVFGNFLACDIGSGPVAVFAAYRVDPLSGFKDLSIYRARPEGIERVLGKDMIDDGGHVVRAVEAEHVDGWIAANDRGTMAAFAFFDTGFAIVRARPGHGLERVEFALDDETYDPTATPIGVLGVTADDSVVASAYVTTDTGARLVLLQSDGALARVLFDAGRAVGSGLPAIRSARVAGDRFVAAISDIDGNYRTVEGSLSAGRLETALPEGDVWLVRDVTPAGRILAERFDPAVGQGEPLLRDDGALLPIPAPPPRLLRHALAVNDRGNLLTQVERDDRLGGTMLASTGPPPQARCFAPPTAVPRRYPTPTPAPAPAPCDPATDPSCVLLQVGSASGRPGERASIEVRLRTGGERIAGVQADLHFPSAGEFVAAADGRPACRVNPAIDKDGTSFGFQPPGCRGDGVGACAAVRTLVLAFDNVAPIPDDQALYTCEIEIAAAARPGTYEIAVTDVGFSDPTGALLHGTAGPGAVEVLASGNAPASETGGGDGCAIAEPKSPVWPLLLLVLLVVGRRKSPLAALLAVALLAPGAARADDFTAREILATGDAVAGFGRIGFGSFTGYGIDDRGRALVYGALSDGSDGLFWVDGAGATPLWRRPEGRFGSSGFDRVMVSGNGRVVGWQFEEVVASGLYEIGLQGLTPLVRAGDATVGGETLCLLWRPVMGDADTLAFTGFVGPAPERCGGPISVFVYDRGVVRRVIGEADLPRVDPEQPEEIELLGVAADGTVALQLGDSGRMLAVRPDGAQRAISPGDLLPSGQRLASVDGRGISPSGELLFKALVDGRNGLYRTDGERIVAVVAEGDEFGPDTISSVDYTVFMNARGDVVASVTSPGLLPNGAGPVPLQAYVFVAATGERRLIRAEADLFGLNAGGDVALQPFDTPARIVRWRAGRIRTLIAAQDAGPDGARFAVGGIQGPHCLAADGRAGSVVYDADYRQGLVCADADGVSTIARQGDPSPDGGELRWLSQCTMTGGGEVLFAAPRVIPEQNRYENDSVYRASAGGIERILGPGVESGGIFIHDLAKWGVGFANDAFTANEAGTVLAWANTEDGSQLLRRRRGSPLQPVRFHLDDPLVRMVISIDWAGIAADDIVVASAFIDRAGGGFRVLLASDGQRARIIAHAVDPDLPSGPLLRFDQLLVRGDQALVIAYGLDQRYHALAFSLSDGGVRELLEPWAADVEGASNLVLRDLTPAPALLFDVVAPSDAFERFHLIESELVRVFPSATDPTDLPAAINDRGNVLSTVLEPHVDRLDAHLRMQGPVPDPDVRCAAVPTAIPRTLPPSTPTPTPVDCSPIGPGCLYLEVGRASGRPGDTVSIDVRLLTGGNDVAGTQSDLSFVAAAPFDALPSGRPACRVNPAIYKNGTASNFLPIGCDPGVDCERLRVLVLALDSVDPIPDGSVLYTCDLTIAAGAAPALYPIAGASVGFSDTRGAALYGKLVPGAIEVLGGGNAPLAEGGGGDGCAVGGTSHSGAWPLLAVGLLAIAPRKRNWSTGNRKPETGIDKWVARFRHAVSPLRFPVSCVLLTSSLSITCGVTAARAIPSTAREIIATGDVIEGFGRVGLSNFALHGIDDRGRLLVSGEVSSGGYGMFWVDDGAVESVWSSLDGPDVARYEAIRVNGSGSVLTWSTHDYVLRRFGPGGSSVVAAPGDPVGDYVICRPEPPYDISDAGVVASLATVRLPGGTCDEATPGLLTATDGELAFFEVEISDFRLLGVGDDRSAYFTHAGSIVAVRDGQRRVVVPDGVTGPSGAPLADQRGLRASSGGALAFEAREDSAPLAIYRLADGVIERVAGLGDILPDGRELIAFDSPGRIDNRVAIDDAGDVAFEALWSEPAGAGLRQREGVVAAPRTGPLRVAAVDAKLHGMNAAGALAIYTEQWGTRIAAERWSEAGLEEVFTGATGLPDGAGLVTQGIWRDPRLAVDGRVGVQVQRPDWHRALVCADTHRTVPMVGDGDAAPDGGFFSGAVGLHFAGAERALFVAGRAAEPGGPLRAGFAIYAATPDGFARLVGPGSSTDDGARLRGFINMDPGGPVYAVNAAGSLVAIADVDYRRALIRRRADGHLERLDLARGDGGAAVAYVYAAGIADDDSVIASVRLADGRPAIVHSDGIAARVLVEPGSASRFGVPLVRGDRVALPALAQGGWTWSLIDLRSGARTALPIPAEHTQVPLRVRSLSPGGQVLFEGLLEDGTAGMFVTDGSAVRLLAAPETPVLDGALLAINDRGNALWGFVETPFETFRNSLHLDGPAPEAACFVPAPAEPRPLPTPDPADSPCASGGPCALMQVGTATGQPGDRVTIEVGFDGGALDVAGVQVDLVLPAPLTGATTNGRPACRINPDIGKSGSAFAFVDTDCGAPGCRQMRALILSLDNVDPIPNGSTLFECEFTIAAGSSAGRSPIAARQLGASTPDGFTLPVAAEDGWVEVLADGTGPANPGSGSSELASDGCQVERPAALSTAMIVWMFVALVAPLVLRSRPALRAAWDACALAVVKPFPSPVPGEGQEGGAESEPVASAPILTFPRNGGRNCRLTFIDRRSPSWAAVSKDHRISRRTLSLVCVIAMLSGCATRTAESSATDAAGETESVIVLEHDPSRERQVYWTSGGYIVVFSYARAIEHLREARFEDDVVEREALLRALTAAGAVGEPLDLDAMVLASRPRTVQLPLRAAFLVSDVLESGRAGLVDTRQATVLKSIQRVRFSAPDRAGRRYETRGGDLVLELVER